jgi:hypothetical protein
LSDTIINGNLKLLQITYLDRKVDFFCLIFLLGHIVFATELMARLGYKPEDCSLQERTGSEANCITRNFVTELLAKYRSNRMMNSKYCTY